MAHMPVKVFSCLTQGLDGKLVEVEVDILQGLSSFSIVVLATPLCRKLKNAFAPP